MKKIWSPKLEKYVYQVDYHGQPTPDGSVGYTKKEMQLLKGIGEQELADLDLVKQTLKGRIIK